MDDGFSQTRLISDLSLTEEDQEQESHLKQVEAAGTRLKTYLENLRD